MSRGVISRIRSRLTRAETDGIRVIRDEIREVYPLAGSLRIQGTRVSDIVLMMKGVATWARLYFGAAVPRLVTSRAAVSRRMLAAIAVAGVVLGFGLVGATGTTLNSMASTAPAGVSGPAVAPVALPSRTDSPATGGGVRFALHRMEARRCQAPAAS